jgi:hypothetical protein
MCEERVNPIPSWRVSRPDDLYVTMKGQWPDVSSWGLELKYIVKCIDRVLMTERSVM